MALSSQINAAAHTPREPKGILIFDRDHSHAPKVDDTDRQSFAVGLCGTAIRHECTANEPNEGDPCTNPLHGQTSAATWAPAGLPIRPVPLNDLRDVVGGVGELARLGDLKRGRVVVGGLEDRIAQLVRGALERAAGIPQSSLHLVLHVLQGLTSSSSILIVNHGT